MADTGSETTMEDILASIKKIIAEDAVPAPRSFSREAIPESVRPRLSPRDDVLDLTGALEPEPAQEQVMETAEPILSEAAQQASRQALEALSGAAKPEHTSYSPPQGVTVEQLASDLLRPMLKEWLDSHLPQIVERLVAQEVARISGRS